MNRYTVLFQGLIVLGTLLCAYSSAMFNRALVPEHCLRRKPYINSNYIPKGREYQIGNLNVYESPIPLDYRVILIAVTDIFGLSNNMKQVADVLSRRYRFRVVMPDFFHGHAWDANNFPPKNEDELDDWMEEYADWNKTVKSDLVNLIHELQIIDDLAMFGIFGMCWGGKVATLAAKEVDDISAAGVVHPASVENDEAYDVQVPMCLLPSQDEPDMIPFYNVLKQKSRWSSHHRFSDMEHGFAGARGNFSDPLIAQRVSEVIDHLGVFFHGYI